MKSSQLFAVALIASLTSIIAMQGFSQENKAAEANTSGQFGAMTPLRGLDVAVRDAGENQFNEKTAHVGIETYRDEDFGTLTYVSKNGSIAAIPQPNNFRIQTLPFERYYEAVRYSPIDGTAWRLNLRTAAWQLINESGPVSPGDYHIEMFTISDSTMVVIRLDQLTGMTWTLTDDKWVKVSEPAGK